MNLHNHYYQKTLDKEIHPHYHYTNDDMDFTENLSYGAIDALDNINEDYPLSAEDKAFLLEFVSGDETEHRKMKEVLLKFNLYDRMIKTAPKKAASRENRL